MGWLSCKLCHDDPPVLFGYCDACRVVISLGAVTVDAFKAGRAYRSRICPEQVFTVILVKPGAHPETRHVLHTASLYRTVIDYREPFDLVTA